jgi:hypothetical protein
MSALAQRLRWYRGELAKEQQAHSQASTRAWENGCRRQ